MMKTLLAILALSLSGCGSVPTGTTTRPALIQRALDMVLPPGFKGDAHVEHSNPYFGFTIDAGNLRRGDQGWEFDWLVFDRHGFTNGKTRLGKPPRVL